MLFHSRFVERSTWKWKRLELIDSVIDVNVKITTVHMWIWPALTALIFRHLCRGFMLAALFIVGFMSLERLFCSQLAVHLSESGETGWLPTPVVVWGQPNVKNVRGKNKFILYNFIFYIKTWFSLVHICNISYVLINGTCECHTYQTRSPDTQLLSRLTPSIVFIRTSSQAQAYDSWPCNKW